MIENMKKIVIISMCIMCQIAIVSAQIGIKTESPQRIFHLDGKSDTSGNTNISDDVVIHDNGNLGVGTLNPTAKLHIESSSDVALRLQDGTEGDLKMLYSKDANGNLSWTDQPLSSAKIYNLNTGKRTFPNKARNMLISIPVTETGNYLVFIRWWGSATATYDVMKHISAYIYLSQANTAAVSDVGTDKDGVEHYVSYPTANAYYSFTTSLFGYMTAGTYLKLWLSPSTPTTLNYDWVIGGVNNSTVLNPSLIVFKI